MYVKRRAACYLVTLIVFVIGGCQTDVVPTDPAKATLSTTGEEPCDPDKPNFEECMTTVTPASPTELADWRRIIKNNMQTDDYRCAKMRNRALQYIDRGAPWLTKFSYQQNPPGEELLGGWVIYYRYVRLWRSSPIAAQTTEAERQLVEILSVALAYIKTDIPEGPVSLDPRAAHLLTLDEAGNLKKHGRGAERQRDSRASAALARSAGVRIALLEEVLLCADQTQECQRNGIVAHVRLSDPQVDENVATVSYGVLHHQERASPRMPGPWSLTAVLTLERIDGRWTVTDMRGLFVS